MSGLDEKGLAPCPFCGGVAEIVHIEEGENAGGSCVCCTQCLASGNVEFEFKENFVSNWNRRAPLSAVGPKAGTVGVKALEWRHRDFPVRQERAETMFGPYTVTDGGNTLSDDPFWEGPGWGGGHARDFDAAKAAAQADYEARILSALTPAPSVAEAAEPVAWRYQFDDGLWSDWQNGAPPDPGLSKLNVERAYARPAPSVAEADLARIDEMMGGQGDDDGMQILPEFEDGMSIVAKVEACLFLLEKRRDVIEGFLAKAPAPPSPVQDELEALSAQDLLMIIAGIKQFGLAGDGADLRDLEAAITALMRERSMIAEHVRKLIPEGQSKSQADSVYGIIGCIEHFRETSESAERDLFAAEEVIRPFAEASKAFDDAAHQFGGVLRPDSGKPRTEFTHGQLRAAARWHAGRAK